MECEGKEKNKKPNKKSKNCQFFLLSFNREGRKGQAFAKGSSAEKRKVPQR